ncbi:hypothetical protein Tco_1278290 [Tanacetum coccineum]
MADSVKDMTAKFRKLDKFEGSDFRRWQKKMHLLLTILKVVYVLNDLFDVYQNVESAKELWDQLEAKYMAEDTSSKKFLVSNFNNYRMVDSSIIDKLSPSWKDFKHMLKHNKDGHFHVKETLRMEESGKGKGKDVAGSSSMNMVEDDKNKKKKQKL